MKEPVAGPDGGEMGEMARFMGKFLNTQNNQPFEHDKKIVE